MQNFFSITKMGYSRIKSDLEDTIRKLVFGATLVQTYSWYSKNFRLLLYNKRKRKM